MHVMNRSRWWCCLTVGVVIVFDFSITAVYASPQGAPADTETAVLRSGPMVGYGDLMEVMLWVQTTRAAEIQYRYWPEGKLTEAALSAVQPTDPSRDNIAHVLLTDLEPGTRFEYELLVDGQVVKRSYPLHFQTQPLWQWRTDPPAFSVAIGSCTYINEPEFDRPGTPYGDNYEIFTAIAALKPDLMLWLGDNVYLREPEFFSESRMRHRNAHTRALPEMQPLLGAAHNYAIWDDHDYGPNDSDRSYSHKNVALQVFKDFWCNPQYGTDELPGVFGRFVWGDIEFFLLDDRYHRSPNRMPEGPDKVMFGPRQMQWLKEALANSWAPFKIVVGGNQMINPLTMFEGFGNFHHEQQDLLNWIRDSKTRGVIFLSGDRHHTELLRVTMEGFYPLYEYTSSPLTSGTHPPGKEAENPARIYGVFEKRNFGMLHFSGPRLDRQLVMECYDNNGVKLWQYEIKAKDLRVD